jgi:hypothetical protein
MTENAQRILRIHFEEWARDRGSLTEAEEWIEDEDTAFERFTADAVLRDRGLADDDLQDANVDGTLDGGIDSVFVFLHGEIVREDSPFLEPAAGRPSQGADIEIFCFQTKLAKAQSGIRLTTAKDTIKRLADLSLEPDDSSIAAIFNERVRSQFSKFRRLVARHITSSPKIGVTFVYATGASEPTSDPSYVAECAAAEEELAKIFPGLSVIARVLTLSAPDLSRLASRTASYNAKLVVSEVVPVSNGFIALASLSAYYDFITSDDGDLLQHLFDDNVRAFQPRAEVNENIRASVDDPSEAEFWWLNNGVTIVCENAGIESKAIALTSLQIVNGLQTSETIYRAFKDSDDGSPGAKDHRVLVRVIPTTSAEARDAVIRATNSQTPVDHASLLATKPIHRDIEQYFRSNDWYYDRRKGYYRNLGRPADRIIGINELGQAVMAMGLGKPHDSRSKPSALLKSESNANAVFDEDISLDGFLEVARLQRKIDRVLLRSASTAERTDLRWLVTCLVATKHLGFRPEKAGTIVKIKSEAVTDAEIEEATKVARAALKDYIAKHKVSAATAAKRAALTTAALKKAGL